MQNGRVVVPSSRAPRHEAHAVAAVATAVAAVVTVGVTLGVAGCSSSAKTELLVLTSLASDAGEPPGAVNVAVFDGYGRIGRARVVPATLPGALHIELPPVERDLRVVVVSEAAPPQIGSVVARTRPHQRVVAEVVLRRDVPDQDGDTIPDDVDVCPAVRDPDQANALGSGPGDACRASADLGASVDLAGASDLAGADLSDASAPRDLSAPPDLAPPADLLSPPSLCPTSTAVLCDSFETGAPLAAWSKNQNRGTITVETTRAYRGTRSLHAHQDALTTGQDAQATLYLQSFPQPDVWVRLFVYVPSAFPAADASPVGALQSVSPWHGAFLNLHSGVFATYNDTPTTPIERISTVPVPTNRWFCLEYALRIGATGYVRASVDGTAIADFAASQSTTATPAIGTLFVGLSVYASANVAARDLWIDEIVIDNKPIGCTQ